MSDNSIMDPKQVAEKLWTEYHGGAVFQASCEAFEAIEKNDISRCLFWREVIKILEADFSNKAIFSLS